MSDMEDAIRYRLCMSELIPTEMSQYRIGAYFNPATAFIL